ncbi:uncharacterized protein LOC117271027 [Epinephelus lanceolatus]|uniref:uncharacterized protein LOC117271027 n=1 Tax=Epinephelus lanceolatus TaxID=310571 RepID=UPI0014486261|nr:uncharacterized protein LOC117271027 [Epinephelus lanceolatus]
MLANTGSLLTNVQGNNSEPQVYLFTLNRFAHRMAGCAARLLLLLSLITTGVIGDDGLICAERVYDITFPCEDNLVCFYIWQLSTSQSSDHIAIVSNGEIQTAASEDQGSKCTLQITDLTAEDVGHYRCQQRPDVFSSDITPTAMPELNLMPGKTVSLQCILLSYVEDGQCQTPLHQVSLTWVDEAGTEIQENSQHQIRKDSSCAVTLTVTLKSPKNKKFRCQATVDDEVQTSVELRVRVPALKGRGRGLFIELEPEDQGGNQDTIGVAVGVVGCLVLTVLVALFAVNRRRTSSQLPDESCYTISTNNIMSEEDVIYADIILPVAPDRVWVHESTEYACVLYK